MPGPHEENNAALSHQACLDAESGLFHLVHFNAALKTELLRLDRWERPLALAIMAFKPRPKTALDWPALAAQCRGLLRPIDQAARIDKNKLAIMLPDAQPDQARRLFFDLRRALAADQTLSHLAITWGQAIAQPWCGLEPVEFLAAAQQDLKKRQAQGEEAEPDGAALGAWQATALAADEKHLLFAGFKNLHSDR